MLSIFWNVIAPIFLMMAVGFVVQRRIGFDLKSLTRLTFWVFVPALLFTNILESDLRVGDVAHIAVHFTILFAVMFAIAWYGARLLGAGNRMQRAVTASVLFYNSGNYG